jgi:hypothetical protein
VAVHTAIPPTIDDLAVVDRPEVIAVLGFEGRTERPPSRFREVNADQLEPSGAEPAETVAEGVTQRASMAT